MNDPQPTDGVPAMDHVLTTPTGSPAVHSATPVHQSTASNNHARSISADEKDIAHEDDIQVIVEDDDVPAVASLSVGDTSMHSEPPKMEPMTLPARRTPPSVPAMTPRPPIKPWRSSNVSYSREEIFLDVHETCHSLWSPDSDQPLWTAVNGKIVVRPRLSGTPECRMILNDPLSQGEQTDGQPNPSRPMNLTSKYVANPVCPCSLDGYMRVIVPLTPLLHPLSSTIIRSPTSLSEIYFHPCVITDADSSQRTIHFTPPDSGFELLRYAVQNVTQEDRSFRTQPFRVTPILEEEGPVDLIMRVQLSRVAGAGKKPGRHVLVQISGPRDVAFCEVDIWDGNLASYAAGNATPLSSGNDSNRVFDASLSGNTRSTKTPGVTYTLSKKEPANICCCTVTGTRKYPLQCDYNPATGLFTCFAESFVLATDIVLRLRFRLNGMSTRDFVPRPVRVSYEIPMMSMSGLVIKSLKISQPDSSRANPSKWVRYNVCSGSVCSLWRDRREEINPQEGVPETPSSWPGRVLRASTPQEARNAIFHMIEESEDELNEKYGILEATALHRLPYHAVEQKGVSEIVVADLVAAGADANSLDAYGRSPLHIATIQHAAHAVKALIMAGANISQQDYNGSTPLHIACASSDVPIAEMLLVAGADTSIQDNQRRSPLALASADTCLNLLVKEWANAKGKPIPKIATGDSESFRSWVDLPGRSGAATTAPTPDSMQVEDA